MNDNVYSLAEAYEIAFSFRDYPQACDFVLEAANLAGMENCDSMLELGCGPGQYCREFAARGIKSFGLDLSPEMLTYLEQQANEAELDCTPINGDMRNFKLESEVSLAICMMATPEHMLTNRDMVDHLNAVADNLIEDGIYLMEFSHPKDFLTLDSSTGNQWTQERDGISVTTHWGEKDRQDEPTNSIGDLDPLTEISDVTVSYEIERNGEKKRHLFRTQTRSYTAGLMRALIELSGRFKIANMYGDLDINQPFDNSKKSWRMIFVLRKWE
ncbi:MAG: class I SAM-dependent methyltransferase [bacterium]|nr:class I SAM-dependent methyltransferase [bacterium]